MEECTRCKRKTHHRCARITARQASSLFAFYCDKCSEETENEPQPSSSRTTQGSSDEPQPGTSSQENQDSTAEPQPGTSRQGSSQDTSTTVNPNEEYDVDEILDHAYIYWAKEIRRYFLIRWMTYINDSLDPTYEESWEEEPQLEGCVGLLKAYCAKHEIKQTNLKETVGGAVYKSKTDRRNWVSIADVIHIIRKYKNMRTYRSDALVGEWNGVVNKYDKINILLYCGHFYVFLTLYRSGICYLADQNNKFMSSWETNQQISSMIGLEIKPVKVATGSNADYCGTIAVMIALTFSQFYKNRDYKLCINLRGNKLVGRIAHGFHKYRSQATAEWSVSDRLVSCPNCNSKFVRAKTLVKHLNTCAQVKQ